MMNPYETLANAIVLSAVRDYRAALKRVRKKPKDKGAIRDAMECERFFRSGWYAVLTNVSGEYLITQLRKEAQAA